MTIIQAIILGIVEGLTEFIPVSSTGHLAIAAKLMGIVQTPFLETFEIAIQSGAILAVLPLFFSRVKERPSILINIMTAFVPPAMVGLIFHSAVHRFLGNYMVICGALIVGGVVIIIIERLHKSKPSTGKKEINIKESILLGCFQAIAIIPGVSRSGATIIGGLLRGLNRIDIVEFSFLLSVPTIMAAGAFDFIKNPVVLTSRELMLLSVGFLTAWISAVICVKAFLRFISHNDFIAFGWYRIAAGIGLMLIFFK